MFILKIVKALCFDTLLQVFILKELDGPVAERNFAQSSPSAQSSLTCLRQAGKRAEMARCGIRGPPSTPGGIAKKCATPRKQRSKFFGRCKIAQMSAQSIETKEINRTNEKLSVGACELRPP